MTVEFVFTATLGLGVHPFLIGIVLQCAPAGEAM